MRAGLSPEIRKQVRPSVEHLDAYDPGFVPAKIVLSANENTHGMPKAVHQKVMDAIAQVPTNRYPDPLANKLRTAIAEWQGVKPEEVLVSNGGDESLFNLVLAYGGADHLTVNVSPTFSVYELYARMVECPVVNIERDPETFDVEVDQVAQAAKDASLVILCSPNNPTGNTIRQADVARVCEACPGLVLVDEAYIEFADAGVSAQPLLEDYDNLIILHTLSKAYCLAGGRVGYLLANEQILEALEAVRQPYSVNAFSQAAALTVVENREAFQPAIEDIKGERDQLIETLNDIEGIRTWPSQANFFCLRTVRAHQVWETLYDTYSILVRDFSAAPGLQDCLRISIGTHEEDEALVAALREIVG